MEWDLNIYKLSLTTNFFAKIKKRYKWYNQAKYLKQN